MPQNPIQIIKAPILCFGLQSLSSNLKGTDGLSVAGVGGVAATFSFACRVN